MANANERMNNQLCAVEVPRFSVFQAELDDLNVPDRTPAGGVYCSTKVKLRGCGTSPQLFTKVGARHPEVSQKTTHRAAPWGFYSSSEALLLRHCICFTRPVI